MAPSRLSTSTFTTFSLPGQPIPLSPAHLIAPAAEAASVFDYNVLHQDEDGDIPEEIFQADDGIDLEEDGSQTPHLLSRSWGHKSKAMLPTLSSYPLSAVFRRCFESRLAQLQAATLDANGQPGRSVSRGRTGQQVDGGWYTLRDGETVTIGELKDGDDDDIGSGRELAEAVSRTITGQVDGVDDLGEPEGRAFRLTSSRSQKRRPQKEITFLLSEIESCEEMIEQLQLVIPLGR
ncbi:hypothetical protein HK101_002045 [Irineochytrium annulatum]|nr:hypothetical protein HK101_002045 [Irineochytrium annulatum]